MYQRRFLRLAVGASTMATLTRAQASGLVSNGCVQVDESTASDSLPLGPNSPQECANYCVGSQSTYIAISNQYCYCFSSPPTLTQQYPDTDHESCSLRCPAPYDDEYCGFLNEDTGEFLYNYYYTVNGPVSLETGSASSESATPSTTSVTSAAATSSTGGAVPTPFLVSSPTASSTAAESSSESSTAAALYSEPDPNVLPAAVSTTLSLPDPEISPISSSSDPTVTPPFFDGTSTFRLTSGISTINPSEPCPTSSAPIYDSPAPAAAGGVSAVFIDTIHFTTTLTCSDGMLDTATARAETTIYHDPSLSTLTTTVTGTRTVTMLVPRMRVSVSTVTAEGGADPAGWNATTMAFVTSVASPSVGNGAAASASATGPVIAAAGRVEGKTVGAWTAAVVGLGLWMVV